MSSSTQSQLVSSNQQVTQFLGTVELIASGQAARTWKIQQPKCIIGSDASCDIQLPGFDVAEQHATILFSKRHALLKSVGGAITVHGRPVREWLFDRSVQFEIGTQRFVAHTASGLGHSSNMSAQVPGSEISNGDTAAPAGQLNGLALEKLVTAIFQPLKEALGELRDGIAEVENQQGVASAELQRESLERFELIKQSVLATIENRFSVQDDRNEKQLSSRLENIEQLLSEYRNEIVNVGSVAPSVDSSEMVALVDQRFIEFQESLGAFQTNTLDAIGSFRAEPVSMQVTAELPDELREKINSIANASVNSQELINEVYANRAEIEATQESIREVKSLLVETQQAAQQLRHSESQSETAGLVEQIEQNQLVQEQLQQELSARNDELVSLNQRADELVQERDAALAQAAQLQETVEQVQEAQSELQQQITTLTEQAPAATEVDSEAVAQQLADKDRQLEEMRLAAEDNAAQWQSACEELQNQRDHFERMVQQLQYDQSVSNADSTSSTVSEAESNSQVDQIVDSEQTPIDDSTSPSVATYDEAAQDQLSYDGSSADDAFDQSSSQYGVVQPLEGASGLYGTGQPAHEEPNTPDEPEIAAPGISEQQNSEPQISDLQVSGLGESLIRSLEENEPSEELEPPITSRDTSFLTDVADEDIYGEDEPAAEASAPVYPDQSGAITDLNDSLENGGLSTPDVSDHDENAITWEQTPPAGDAIVPEEASRDEEVYGALRDAFREEHPESDEEQLSTEEALSSASAAEQRLDALMGLSNAESPQPSQEDMPAEAYLNLADPSQADPSQVDPSYANIEQISGGPQAAELNDYNGNAHAHDPIATPEVTAAEAGVPTNEADEESSFDYNQFLSEEAEVGENVNEVNYADNAGAETGYNTANQELPGDSANEFTDADPSYQADQPNAESTYQSLMSEAAPDLEPPHEESDFSSFGGLSYEENADAHDPQSSVADSGQVTREEPVHQAPPEPENPEDDSVEAYMQRLLQRVQGGTNPPVPTEQSAPVETKPAPETSIDIPQPQVEPELPVEEPGVMTAEEFIPRTEAAERNTDMAAMRDLANSTARSAIETSIRKRNGVEVLFKSSVAVFGFLAAGALFLINGLQINIALAGMLAGFIVAGLWGYEAVTQARTMLALEPADNDRVQPRDNVPNDDGRPDDHDINQHG